MTLWNHVKVGVLCGDADDFENVDDVFDAVGDILLSVADEKTETNIREICEEFFKIMKPKEKSTQKKAECSSEYC